MMTPSQFDANRKIKTMILCGCFRCGQRLVDRPCVVDALQGTPTAVHCPECADIVEAGRVGQEAALAGKPIQATRFATCETQTEYEAEYLRAMAILGGEV